MKVATASLLALFSSTSAVKLDNAKTDLPQCEQPIITGFCRAAFPKFGYNPETNTCSLFIYGGCQGNQNSFSDPESCVMECGNENTKVDFSVQPSLENHFPDWAHNLEMMKEEALYDQMFAEEDEAASNNVASKNSGSNPK